MTNRKQLEYPMEEQTNKGILSSRDFIWVCILALIGATINFLPFNNTVSLGFQVFLTVLIVAGNIKRPVMAIVAFVFLYLLPVRIVGGFNEEIVSYYRFNRAFLIVLVFAFFIGNILLVRVTEQHKGKFNKSLLLFALFVLASYFWTISAMYYDFGLLWICTVYIFFPYFISNEKDVNLVLIAYAAFVQIFGFSIISKLLDGRYYRGSIRLDPNFASFTILLGIASILVLLMLNKQRISRSIRWLMMMFILFDVVVMSYFASRTAFGSLGLVIFAYMLLNAYRIRNIIYTAIAAVSTYTLMEYLGYFDTLFKRFSATDLFRAGGRIPIWQSLWVAFIRFEPLRFLFGNGYLTTGLFGRGVQAHNTFLSLLINFGLIGFMFFMTYQVSSIIITIKRRAFPYLLVVLLLMVYQFSLEPHLLSEGLVFFALMGYIGNPNTIDNGLGRRPIHEKNSLRLK